MLGADAEWTLGAHLQASAVDALWVANWQRSTGKKSDYPKPIPRPGVKLDTDTAQMTPEPLTFAEVDAFLENAYRG